MSVVVFADHHQGTFKKASFETLSFAQSLQAGEVIAVVLGNCPDEALKGLGRYGADKVWHAADSRLDHFDAAVWSQAIRQAVESCESSSVILPNTYRGKALGPMLSVQLKSSFISGISGLHVSEDAHLWKKTVFSGKATAHIRAKTDRAVLCLNPNSVPLQSREVLAELVSWNPDLPESHIQVLETKTLSGEVPLTEADLVVSGGRGLKGPENWGMIEELAHTLKAATACSRPVADAGWRPHHEHVGQTGISIRPKLYIAIGISGAIQHLAGVSGSKYIVVINSDPEAPFFKAADYGIVGDAFEVVPQLTQAIKAMQHEGQ